MARGEWSGGLEGDNAWLVMKSGGGGSGTVKRDRVKRDCGLEREKGRKRGYAGVRSGVKGSKWSNFLRDQLMDLMSSSLYVFILFVRTRSQKRHTKI